jgi:hypothetical protein
MRCGLASEFQLEFRCELDHYGHITAHR